MNQYTPQGVCSSGITFEVVDGMLHNVRFIDGCPGNLLAIGKLLEGMRVDEAMLRLKGIRCGDKPTSCADQLAAALEQYQTRNAGK